MLSASLKLRLEIFSMNELFPSFRNRIERDSCLISEDIVFFREIIEVIQKAIAMIFSLGISI